MKSVSPPDLKLFFSKVQQLWVQAWEGKTGKFNQREA